MPTISAILLSLTFLLSANANDPIDQSTLSSQGLYPFVLASRPLWEFGIPSKHLCITRSAPCYPDYAVDPVTLEQHAGAGLQDWPKANGGCRLPEANGKAGGIRGQAFPNYYYASQCNDNEIRIGFWVYYPKDGFIGSGHKHDWENYVVVWKRSGDGKFYRDQHLMSYHGGRTKTQWTDVPNTVNDDLSSAGKGKGNHAKIYPGWSKHANFDTKKTTVCDTLLQSTQVAYRSDDWWYFPQESDLVQADLTTPIGQKIEELGQAGKWGSADGWPSRLGPDMCGWKATSAKLVKADHELTLADLFPNGIPFETDEASASEVNTTFPLGSSTIAAEKREDNVYYPRTCSELDAE